MSFPVVRFGGADSIAVCMRMGLTRSDVCGHTAESEYVDADAELVETVLLDSELKRRVVCSGDELDTVELEQALCEPEPEPELLAVAVVLVLATPRCRPCLSSSRPGCGSTGLRRRQRQQNIVS